MKHYVIGDVHGHYNTLLALVDKLPKDIRLIFVGDLIDRGPKSMEVVKFVREGGHLCVRGNHEELMVKDSTYILNAYHKNRPLDLFGIWMDNGGVQTLVSYGLIQKQGDTYEKVEHVESTLKKFEDDITWMQSLPLSVELDISHPSGNRVVISHACIGSVWHLRDKEESTFREYALWNRKTPPEDMPIFNIFGHTPVEFSVEIEDHYVNVDTGCYVNEYGYGELSAYCVETGEVVKVNRRLEELQAKEV